MTSLQLRAHKRRRVAPDYLRLVRAFPLRPIQSEQEYDQAASVVDRLAVRDEGSLTAGERDYLQALTLMVEAYDRDRFPAVAGGTPLQRLRSLVDSAGLSPSELGDVIGSRPAASMILKGVREPSKAQVRKLARHFKMSADYFL